MVRNNRQSDRDVTLYKDACNWKNNQLVPLVVVGGGGGGGGAVIVVKKFRISNSTTAVNCSTNLDFVTPWHHCTERSGNQTLSADRLFFLLIFCTIMTGYPANFN